MVSASLPFAIGTIPLLSDILTKVRSVKNGNITARNGPIESSDPESVVQVTITDEAGNPVESANDELSAEMESLLSSKKRVRMPSSILSELYPSLPSPYYKYGQLYKRISKIQGISFRSSGHLRRQGEQSVWREQVCPKISILYRLIYCYRSQ